METHIYMITNKINNKKYIGRTVKNISKRLNEHYSDSKYIKTTNPLHKEIKKYGINNFKIECLFNFESDNFYDSDTIELFFIKKFNCLYPDGYNKRIVRR